MSLKKKHNNLYSRIIVEAGTSYEDFFRFSPAGSPTRQVWDRAEKDLGEALVEDIVRDSERLLMEDGTRVYFGPFYHTALTFTGLPCEVCTYDLGLNLFCGCDQM